MKNILLIEDDYQCQEIVRLRLEQEGYSVFTANNGMQGVQLAQKINPDLIISDVFLPLKNGFEVCSEVKQNPALHKTPVILMSAVNVDELDKKRGRESGANDYLFKADLLLTKPYSGKLIVKYVNEFLAGRTIQEFCSGKVLVIDDSPKDLELAELRLTEAGYQVFCAETCNLAWEIVLKEQPDVLLLDVILPDGSGLDFLQKVKDFLPEVAVIISTAYGSEEVVTAALKKGANDYITKPLSYRTLGKTIAKAMEKQKKAKFKDRALSYLKESHQNLNSILEHKNSVHELTLNALKSGIVTVDIFTRVRFINSWLLETASLPVEEVVGSMLEEISKKSESVLITRLADILTRSTRSGKILIGEEIDTGDNRFFKVDTQIITDLKGNMVGTLAFVTEISVQKEVERFRQLQQRQEGLSSLGRIAAGMAHEIRNPITAVRGLTQLIAQKTSENGQIKEFLKIILDEIDRANKVIEDFLKLSRPSPPCLISGSLNEVIKEITELIGPQCFLCKIEVCRQLDPFLPQTLFDRSQMKQMLLNMTLNSIQAMQQGGVLKIETSYITQSKKIRLDIIDNGCGIPEKILNQVGKPFFTTRSDGTGLGLSNCYAIIDNHNGYITMHSEEGKGTSFSIYLPVKGD